MSEKSVQENLDEMFGSAQKLVGYARTDDEKRIIEELLSSIDKARHSFRGNVPVQRNKEKMKYGVKFYTNDGHFGFAEYRDDFYYILQLYVQDHSKCRPTLWVYDREHREYVRVHDFNFNELSPETYRKYLDERVIWGDKLLKGIDPSGIEERVYGSRDIRKETIPVPTAEPKAFEEEEVRRERGRTR